MHFNSLLRSCLALAAFTNAAPTPDAEAAAACSGGKIIRDGGFESGRTPPTSGGNSWTVVGFIGSSTYNLTSPGSTMNGGNYAFNAILRPGPFTNGASGETLTQTLCTQKGLNYSILADYRFDATVNNQCSVKVQYPFKDSVGSVTTGSGISPAGSWYTTGGFFQAVAKKSRLDFIFSCSGGASNNIGLDNVKVKLFNGNAY